MADYTIDENGNRVYPIDENGNRGMVVFMSNEDNFLPDIEYGNGDPNSPSTRGRSVSGSGNGKKPDGTSTDSISVGSSGSATRQMIELWGNSGLPGTGATFNTSNVGKIQQDPTKTGLDFSFASSDPSRSGPPFENVLENFSSYNALWTMACLEPSQFNNPLTYRNNPSALKSIVFSSAGRFNEGRVPTVNGTPEFFVDNVEIRALMTPVSSGNTNAINFTFEIFEPYSMGLFLQSLQVAAINSGYPNYLGRVPFLFQLDFIGNTDDGTAGNTVSAFTKYFTLQITGVTQQVDASGSKYTVTAIPLHHMGFADSINQTKSVVKLAGGSVVEVLASGESSLVSFLNKVEQDNVKSGKQQYPDIYEIVFPADASDNLGVSTGASSLNFGATLNPVEIVQTIIKSTASQVGINVGGNPISQASMNFTAEVGGNFVHPKESDVIDSATGVTDREKMRIDPTSREFHFAEQERITQIIQKVILVSDYAAAAVDPENLVDGSALWFRVDVQMQLLEYDSQRNTRAKKIIYRVLPYIVDGYILTNPSAAAPGIPARDNIVAKRYDYIYSGRNNSILNLTLQYDTMYFTGASPRSPDLSGTKNPDTQSPVDSPQKSVIVNQSGSSTVTSASGSKTVGTDANTVKRSPTGQKNILEQVADVFQTRFQESSADMVNVEMEILGDPYFLSDSGVNSNYFSPKGINSQITADNSLNYEGSDIWVFIAFRTPVEPNLSTSQQGGLYDFQNGGGVSPYSGYYRVIEVGNKFSNGTFTQTLKMIRPPGQPNDLVGQESIDKENLSLFGKIFTLPPKSSPAADQSTEQEPDGLDRLSNLVDGATGAVQSITNIAGQVASGNLIGAFGSVTGIAGSFGRTSPNQENQRPTSQIASAAPQTTGSRANSVTVVDIAGEQRQARAQAFSQALASGATERQADAAGNAAGNLAGADAFRRLNQG